MWKSTARSSHSHRSRRLTHLSILDGALYQSEANFFEPYVEGDMAAFLRYLDVKRRNAVWGDDPEVQALCEIYDRPAEIWAYDPQVHVRFVSALTIRLYILWVAYPGTWLFLRGRLPQIASNSCFLQHFSDTVESNFVCVEAQ